MESELSLSIGGLPPLSSRGCIQQLTPINDGEFHRTINGNLIFLGNNQSKKYRSIIDCEDKTPLATDGLHRGCEVVVGCIQRLWQKVCPQISEVFLEKNPVNGSIIAVDNQYKEIPIIEVDGRRIIIALQDEPCFINYRPLLNMRTITYKLSINEWGIKVGWHLELEEM